MNYVRNGDDVGPLEGFSCQLVVNESIDWLDQREAAKPFFLYMAFHEPHEPVASPAELVAEYKDVASSEDEAQFFANVANVDKAVGHFVQALDERKLRDDTLIVFTSDNGPETLNRYRGSDRSFGQPGPLKGMKLHTHDAGFRVAGIMNWPGSIPPDQVLRTPISSLDFLPTFCALAGTSPSADLELDGTSLIPVFGNRAIERTKPLVWCYFNAINDARVAMRHGKWKVLAQLNGGAFPKLQNVTANRLSSVQEARLTNFEIYDIESDIGESKNLVNSEASEIGQLQKLLSTSFQELVSNSHAWTVKDD